MFAVTTYQGENASGSNINRSNFQNTFLKNRETVCEMHPILVLPKKSFPNHVYIEAQRTP